MARDLVLVVYVAALAEVVGPLFVFEETRGPLLALLPYLALALVAAIARAFFDTRGGELPRVAAVLRSVFVAGFAGIVVASVLGEYAIAPGYKMAAVLVAAFFSDSTIAALGRLYRAQVARAAPTEPSRRQRADPPSGGVS